MCCSLAQPSVKAEPLDKHLLVGKCSAGPPVQTRFGLGAGERASWWEECGHRDF